MAKAEAREGKTAEKGKEVEVIRPSRALSPFEEMDRWFENVFPRGWMQPLRREWPSWGELTVPLETRIPKIDVVDRDDEMLLRAEIPGVEKGDLDVSVSDNAVTIKGEIKREEKEEKGDYYRCEISQGAFARTVTLPEYVDSEKVTAKFKNGMLELTLPKIEKAKRRSIKID
jgi:HSP20 family protein